MDAYRLSYPFNCSEKEKVGIKFMEIVKKIISELLWLANSRPPALERESFYKMKSVLLNRYGKKSGIDVQHIKKECWECNKNGIYQEFWTMLQKYQLGNHIFHVPISERLYENPNIKVTITDYIKHKSPKYYLSAEALYWLALIYDRQLFWNTFGHCGHISKKYTPLVILGTWIFKSKQIWRKLKYSINDIFNKRMNCDYDDLPF